MDRIEIERDTRRWAMACHLAALSCYLSIPFGNLLGPLLVWLFKREDDPFIEEQGREALNFQLSITLYGFIAFLLCFIFIGLLLLPVLVIFHLVCTIIAGVKAGNGEAYRYPLTIRFLH